MKKRDRLTPKKKRAYRMDHAVAYRRWEESLNKPFEETLSRFRELLNLNKEQK